MTRNKEGNPLITCVLDILFLSNPTGMVLHT